jgi:hypothetical protein
MATISNTPRPGYVWDSTDNVWYPIGVGGHGHSDYITQATAVNPTIIDAKGDIITATAADTPARLAVGNNGETLVADSSTSTGLRYQAPVNFNPVLNSAFQVWQRGTSVSVPASTGNTYSADRWTCQTGTAAITISRQATGDTTNLPFIQYCARYQRNSGQTGTNTIPFVQNFESINTIPFAGKTITFSFYARAGANYSPTSNALAYNLAYGTGTDQNVLTAYTGETNVVSGTATLTTTWQRFTATAAMSASATEMYIRFNYSPTGTAGVNDYYEVTGVQVEVGSVATPFKTYAGTIQGELAACMRYYEKSYPQGTAPAAASSSGLIGGLFSTAVGTDNNNYYMNYFSFKVVKRSSPTLTIYDVAGNTGKATAMSLSSAQTNNITATSSDIVDSAARVYVGQLDGKAGFIFHYQANAEL